MEPTWVVWLRDNMPQDLFADMRKENTGWRNRAEKAEAEIERLRSLCAARPRYMDYAKTTEGAAAYMAVEELWRAKIDAAGRGEEKS